MIKRLLIDISHILKACLHVAERQDSATSVEFNGSVVSIPDAGVGYEIFIKSYKKTLQSLNMTPIQSVIVKDGKHCKEMRRKYLPGYCVRDSGPPEWMDSFHKALAMTEETLLKYGAIAVHKDGCEADDVIAALADKVDSIIWSGDKDLLAAGDVFYKGEINPDLFHGIAKKHIVVYKALVGDPSDKIPGARGFGERALLDMVAKYGDECLDEFITWFEDKTLDDLEDFIEEFKPFMKILENADTVYASYECARFHHPGWDLEWKMLYPGGDEVLPEWKPTQELITADKLTPQFLFGLESEMKTSNFNSFDIETYTTEDGKRWMEANKSKEGKMPLDVLGQVLTGFSITTGVNSHKTYYFPVRHKDTDCITIEQATGILNLFQEDIPTIIQNTQFEFVVCRLQFDLRFDRGWLPQNTHDTQIMCGYVDEEARAGLKHNSKRWLGYDQTSYETVTTKYAPDGTSVRVGMNELTGEEVLSYGCDDTICTGSLYSLYTLIMGYEETWNCYEKCDISSSFLYAEKFINGVKFDLDKLSELQQTSNKEYDVYYDEIQTFLNDLVVEEDVEIEREHKRITISDLLKMKKDGVDKPQESEYETIVKRWPGCEYVPATELAPSEIKRLYSVYTGKILKTKVRKTEKMAAAIEEKTFSGLVRKEDLDGLNDLVSESFISDPELSLQSPPQMCSLLYDFLKLPVRIRGKLSDTMRKKGQRQGNPSANEDALRHAIVYDLQDDKELREFVELLIKARSCKTQDGLYFKPYKNMQHYSDGMVHPQFKISAQKTGRGTAAGPNDAQVAKDGAIREVYCPYDDDYLWVSIDLKSQELAHIAWHSQDENMLKCFTGVWEDIHSKTGVEIYNMKADVKMTFEEFNVGRKTNKKLKDIRNTKAKPGNFRKTYDGSAPGLAIDLLCSEKEAQDILDAFSNQFPGVDKYINKMKEVNEDRGYAVTPMGRRKHLWRILDGSWKDNHELRSAGNQPIQGGAGEQIKLAVCKLWDEKVFDTVDAYFAGTVHDELNALVKRSDVIEYIKIVHPVVCQKFCDFEIDFKSSVEVGRNFGTLIECGDDVSEATLVNVQKVIDESYSEKETNE